MEACSGTLVRSIVALGGDITPYDQAHFLTYARLLDAERDGGDWRISARHILGLDTEADPAGARACFDSHLARAHWVVGRGYHKMLEEAGLI